MSESTNLKEIFEKYDHPGGPEVLPEVITEFIQRKIDELEEEKKEVRRKDNTFAFTHTTDCIIQQGKIDAKIEALRELLEGKK